MYAEVIEKNGWVEVAGIKDGNFKPKTVEENDQMKVIDFTRHETHRIYDVEKLVKADESKLLRKCQFPFKADKNGSKSYEKKTLEVKIEFYSDEKSKGARSRKRMGLREINLSDYINKGPVVECLRLDTTGKTS